MSKKIVAMLMAVAMAFSLLPVTAFAAGTTPTPDVVDGYYNDDNQWVKGEKTRSDELQDTVTTVDKTAKKVDGQDNQYEVTLKVEMKHKETAVPPGAAATVLVIDKSGSMNENNRLSAAKTAAINFLKSYSGFSDSDFNKNGSLKKKVSDKNLKRYVSLVTFNDSASLQTWGNGNNTKSWVDVSTKDGYNKLFTAINIIWAGGGTNLDAALRLAKTQSDKITQIEKSKRNVIALTDGVPTFYGDNVEKHGNYGCPDTNAATAQSADALKANVKAVYTVCFGAAGDQCWTKGSAHAWEWTSGPFPEVEVKERHQTDGPTVGDFLEKRIATSSTSDKQYAYDADDADKLYEVFAAITQTITDGLNEGVVKDGLPNGVSCTDDTFGEDRTLTWNLKSNEATVTKDGEYNVYTYTKTYKVNVDPATVKTVEVGGVNYAPLNTPTILTVQHNGSPVQIPFPIPAIRINITQATVTFKVENGTWSDGETGDKTTTVTMINGKGTLSNSDVPTEMKANANYEGGAWDTTPTTETNGITGDVIYTYSFTPKKVDVNLSDLIKKELTVKKGSTLPTGTTFNVTVTPQTANSVTVEDPQPIPGTVSDLGTGNTNGDGDTIYTASFNFGPDGTLSLSAGTYTYTVQENATSPISGMQYDSNTYTLKITVTGSSYSAEYTTTNEEKVTPVTADSPLTIKNTYQTPDLSVTKRTVSVDGKAFDSNPVAHVGEQIVWEVSVKNNKTTQASTQLKDTLGGVAVYSDEKLQNSVNLGTDGTWTAMVPANKTVTYYVTYTVKADDIPKGEIVNTIVMKNGDKKNSDPVSTWDTKQLKSAISLNSDWTTTVTLELPTVSKTEQQPDPIAVKSGSYVIDQIGNEFTFMDGLSLKVNNKELSVTKDETNKNLYHFRTETGGTDLYTVTYTDKNDETKTPAQFKWEIKENIPAGTKVTLSYKLELTTREKNPGTYGVEDLKGNGQIEQGKTPIYTNEKAALYIKENDQEKEIAVFPKPSVSYTVSSGSSGSHSGGSRPSLNTKDHYGYIIGYPVDYYTGQPTTDQTKKPVRPEGKITRAEVATIYFRMLTDESRTKFWSQSNAYSDVKAGDWFNNAVSTLSNAGIIAGYEDGSFRPNGYITRAEFATIAARFFDVTYNGKDLFPDISGHWAKDYINQAANKGFVNGYEDGTFKPDRNITRAEAVTLVNRTLDRHPDKSHFTKDMLVWPDNMDQTKWYYADMQEATNSHTYQMKENSDKTKYENWTKTLPIRNWEALEKAWSNANSSQGNGNVV